MIRANIETDIAPIVGNEKQAEDLAAYIKSESESDEGVWSTNIFGKSVEEDVYKRQISFQTMNPELRCRMLHNRFAGESLKKADILYEAGIEMNGQIVLCKGINDGDELEYSIRELTRYLPNLQSVSVVPVGLSKYRDGLEPLEPFGKEDAEAVIDTIERWQEDLYRQYGKHVVHASDEWYLLAGRELPEDCLLYTSICV